MSRDFPPLTATQQLKLEQFADRLKHQPAAVIDYLVMLRRLMILAGIRQRSLASRVAAIEPTPPEGQTRFGHSLDGEFVEQRASEELMARDRLPRPQVDEVVAKLYAKSPIADRSATEVAKTLGELRQRAERAAEVHQERRAEQGYKAGTRQPTYDDLQRARRRGEAEAARIEEKAAELLTKLGIRYEELAVSLEARIVTFELLLEQTGSLQSELATLRDSLGHAGRLLKAQTTDLAEVIADRDEALRREHALRAEADQLAARVGSLRRELARRQGVREGHPDYSSPQFKAMNELAEMPSRVGGSGLGSDTSVPRHALGELAVPTSTSSASTRPDSAVPIRIVSPGEDGPLRTTLTIGGGLVAFAVVATLFLGWALGTSKNSDVLPIAGDVPTLIDYGVDRVCGKTTCVPVETVDSVSWELNSASSVVNTTFGFEGDRDRSGTPLDGIEGRLRITAVGGCTEAAVSWTASTAGVVVGQGVVTSARMAEELSPQPLPADATQVTLTLASVDPQCTTSVAWEEPWLNADGFLPFS